MDEAAAFDDIIASIRQDLASATEALMAVAEAGLSDVVLARGGDGEALSRIEGGLLGVLQACAIEDLVGQRLTQLQTVSASGAPAAAVAHGERSLLNGPARPGQGLTQDEIDAWLLET